MALVAKEVTFGAGSLDRISSNSQHSSSDQAVSVIMVFQGPEEPRFCLQDQIAVTCPRA